MEHHVYFWLKDEHKDELDLISFEKALDELCKIGEIASSMWGKSAPTPVRPVTEKSFDYALSIKFDSVEKHDLYQVHPDHDVFVDAFKPWWDKVLIMDVE